MTTEIHASTRPQSVLLATFLCGLIVSAPLFAQDGFSLEEPAVAASDPEAIEALTEIQSFIEIGLGYIGDDAIRFGRYRGLEHQGGYGVLNIDWFRRPSWNSPDPTYTRFIARDLGLTSRRARLEHGRQGDYRWRVDYARTPLFRSDSASTIFNGAGSSALTLPGDWVAAQNTAGMTRLLPSLVPTDVRHERRRFGLRLDKLLAAGWDISTDVRNERKQGMKIVGAVIGNSGGNPRAVLIPEPIDYETNQADVSLRYTDARKQLEFRYLVSLFNDGNRGLSWQNPYAAINGWDSSAGYPTGFGQLALPPDNQFHQASVLGGYNWNNGLRLIADLALGRMTQDEAFLPYSINPVLADSITQPLPRASLDGRIDTTVANIRLSGRGSDRMHWNASARFDDRDNRTPRDEYVYIGGDSQAQDTDVTSSRRRFNEPYSFRETVLKLDGGYRLARRTRMTAAIERRDTERTYSEREQADETTLTLNLRHAASEWFSGALRLIHADRSGSTYHGDEPFLSGYAPGYTSTVAGGWDNPPALRRFHLADRNRDRIGANLNFTPNQFWNLGFDAQRVEDDYDRSELGLTDNSRTIYTVDLSFVPSTRWSSHLFFSSERADLNQEGQSISRNTREQDAIDPARHWSARHRDRVETAGVGLQWAAIEDRLDLGLDYVQARSRSLIDVQTGSALSSAPLPPERTEMKSLSLVGKYRLREGLTLNLRVWNERYSSSDFAIDGIPANQLANVILLGETSPDYSVNVITFSLVYRFR